MKKRRFEEHSSAGEEFDLSVPGETAQDAACCLPGHRCVAGNGAVGELDGEDFPPRIVDAVLGAEILENAPDFLFGGWKAGQLHKEPRFAQSTAEYADDLAKHPVVGENLAFEGGAGNEADGGVIMGHESSR